MADPISSIVHTYTQRFRVRKPYSTKPPREDLCLILAIPSYKEPDISKTLQSLAACKPPSGSVEIIIVINASELASAATLAINRQTVEQIREWEKNKPSFASVLVIQEEAIPNKQAGAGMARKIAMDEAVQRWAMIGHDGPIVCLDADCTVSENYLVEAEIAFTDQSVRAAHFYFEHEYEKEKDRELRKGILHYELHLRCYVQGLRLAGYPFAVHTVGSCMSVRASAYAKAGGMNKRNAGEDFYFLHKVLPHGGWKDIAEATVYPACRASDRVPFGTGRAQLEWLNGLTDGTTYHADIYLVLRPLFRQVTGLVSLTDVEQSLDIGALHPEVQKFLTQESFYKHVREMQTQANSAKTFVKRFWQWMDGFMVLKLVHFLRDHGFSNQPVLEVGEILLARSGKQAGKSFEEVLGQFRLLDHPDS